ncbi:rhamnan synthesis F family protein [Euryhalocaulis caribicus]|uniref:rhamnan synthesis F family protein n=1 Tax=Euryhalocaulis caribicus TaxID=1161401 RepID=UPI0003A0114F|nr:rhamnan synthesis F family protein [Euryhalocaulis caribicus]
MPAEDQLDDAIIDRIERSCLFDYDYYRARSGQEGGRRDLIGHYMTEGARDGLRPSPVFDAQFYVETYADVQAADVDPFQHYVLSGRAEGRYPGPEVLRADAFRIRSSGLFDFHFYRKRYGTPHDQDAIEHYLKHGVLNRFRPRPDFDGEFYGDYYPDWTAFRCPFMHYVEHHERRWAYPSFKAADRIGERLRDSEYFDEDYYRERYLHETPDLDPVVHFCTYGFRRGYEPSARFDAQYYLANHPDIMEAEVNPLLHFIDAGASEGRAATPKTGYLFNKGGRTLDPNKPTVLVVCHDANRTGAPILGLNLVAELSRDHNVVSWLGRPGDLADDFADFSIFTLKRIPEPGAVEAVIKAIGDRAELDYAILNSVETNKVAPALTKAGIPIVSLIHEFSEYSLPRGKIGRSVLLSDVTIFPANLVRESAIDELESFLIDDVPDSLITRHQGRCVIGTTEASDDDLTREQLYAKLKLGEAPEAADDDEAPAAAPEDPDKPFVVMGAGWVHPRKGVDLFISTARHFKKLTDRPFRFVWVGGNYRPKNDINYSVWLADEVKRSGLEDEVVFVDEQGSLNTLWSMADAFYLPSRLDPFPNVVLDALAHRTPVVCFEGATGVADLASKSFPVQAAPYQDKEAAAAALKSLADGEIPEFDETKIEKLLDFPSYVDEIRAAARRAKESVQRQAADAEAILNAGLFQKDFFDQGAPAWLQVRNNLIAPRQSDLVKLYCKLAAHGVFPAKSRRGFNDRLYAATHGKRGDNPLATIARSGDVGLNHDCICVSGLELDESEPPQGQKTALHIHLHYDELAPDMLSRLLGADASCDLFITTTGKDKAKRLKTVFSAYRNGKVEIKDVPNRGRDIGPFLAAWPGKWSEYDVVGHIHGKKSADLQSDQGDTWRDYMIDRLLGGRAALNTILTAFAEDQTLGLVFPEDPHIIGWTENREEAARFAERIGLAADALPDVIEFPLGNMFWARTAALKPMLDEKFDWTDFPAEPLPYDGTMLHAIERMLPVVCEATGHHWRTVDRTDRRAAGF